MKKLIVVATVTLLTCNFAFAEDMFFGVEGGVSKQSLKLDVPDDSSVDLKYKIKPSIGIKFGSYFSEQARAYVGYTHTFSSKIKEEDDGVLKTSSNEFMVGADYLPKVSDNFSILLGGYFGSDFIINKGLAVDNGSINKKARGLLIGAKIGGVTHMDKQNLIEFGLKGSSTIFKDSKLFKTTAFVGYSYKF